MSDQDLIQKINIAAEQHKQLLKEYEKYSQDFFGLIEKSGSFDQQTAKDTLLAIEKRNDFFRKELKKSPDPVSCITKTCPHCGKKIVSILC